MAKKTTKKASVAKEAKAKTVKKTETAKPKAVKKDEAAKTAKKPAAKTPKKAKKTTAAAAQAPSPEKKEIIEQYAVKSGDTGSPEVQVALLTRRIEKLVAHLKTNPHDNHSRRGLLGIVSKRRRLLNYLEKKDAARFKEIKKKLELS